MANKRNAMTLAFGLLASTMGPGAALAEAPAKLPDWVDYMAALTAAGKDNITGVYKSGTPQDRQEAWQIMFGEIARGYLSYVTADPDHPEFVPTYNMDFNIAAPNPDYIYSGTPLNGKGIYRLRGLKGNNRFTFMQVTGPLMSDPKKAAASMFNSFRLDQVPGGLDGSFELILSAERPKGYTGNWQFLDPNATGVFMRSVAYDWLHDRDPVVGIERLDAPVRRERPSAEATAAQAPVAGPVRQARQRGVVEAHGRLAGPQYVEPNGRRALGYIPGPGLSRRPLPDRRRRGAGARDFGT